MAKLVYSMAVLIVGWLLCPSMGLPTPDEEHYLNKDYNRELLVNWLNSAQYPQRYEPCRYYSGNSLTAAMPKRNAELINSLLSLPKNMNEAGK